jgi:hypothetical protein
MMIKFEKSMVLSLRKEWQVQWIAEKNNYISAMMLIAVTFELLQSTSGDQTIAPGYLRVQCEGRNYALQMDQNAEFGVYNSAHRG